MTIEADERRPGRRRPSQLPNTVDVVGLDHVQLGMPQGEEALARLFYGRVMGLQEVRKPRQLAKRGGVWFTGSGVAVHLGIEEPFRPADKAHPALVVRDLDHARRQLSAHQIAVEEDDSGAGLRRCYVRDPFGNRIELVDAADAGFTERRIRRVR